MEVSPRGNGRVTAGGAERSEPYILLKLPAKAGDSWSSEPAPGRGRPAPRSTYTTVKVDEEIEVPAGKFKCVRVEAVSDANGRERKVTSWYAPGVGLVRMDGTGPDGTSKVQRELKSFTPGK
jgi:hypothetical protein